MISWKSLFSPYYKQKWEKYFDVCLFFEGGLVDISFLEIYKKNGATYW